MANDSQWLTGRLVKANPPRRVSGTADVRHPTSGTGTAAATITPQLFQPNGAGCDGDNYSMSLRATSDGQLLPRDPDEVITDGMGRISVAVPTDCGVNEVTDGYSSYARVGGVLSDGAGRAPADWNTPYQRGWAAIDGGTLVFSDERGRREVFLRVPDGQAPAPCG